MICAVYLLPKDILDPALVPVTLKALASGIFMAVSIWLFQQCSAHWLIQGVCGISIYLISLILMKTIQPDELTFVKNFLSYSNLKLVFIPYKKGANA